VLKTQIVKKEMKIQDIEESKMRSENSTKGLTKQSSKISNENMFSQVY